MTERLLQQTGTAISSLEDLQGTVRPFFNLFSDLPVAGYICEAIGDYQATYISNNVVRLTGYSPSAFTGHAAFWVDHIHPEDVDRVLAECHAAVATGSCEYEYRWRIADGTYRWFFDSFAVVRAPDGSPSHLVGTWRDVTERKEASQAMRAILHGTSSVTGESFFQLLAESLARYLNIRYVIVCENVDHPTTRVRTQVYWNDDHFEPNIEYSILNTPCEYTARGKWTYYPSGVRAQFPDDHELVTMQAESYCGFPLISRSGQQVGHLAFLDDKPLQFDICGMPATPVFAARAAAELERLKIQRDLEHSEARQSAVLQTAPMVLYTSSIKDKGLITTWVSDQVERITGYPSQRFVGDDHFWPVRLHPDDHKHVLAQLHSLDQLDSLELEYRWQCADGEYRWFMDRPTVVRGAQGRPTEIIGTWMDITDRKQSELENARLYEELAHIGALDAIGTFSSGVAHDFDNLLTTIAGYTEMANKLLPDDHTARKHLGQAGIAIDQARQVTRSLLAMTRETPSSRQRVDLAELTDQSMQLLRRIVPEHIVMTFDIPDTPVWIEAAPLQIQRVLMNLTANAKRVMPEGGLIRVTLACEQDKAVLDYQDSGPGIDPQVQARIFDPFFSTQLDGAGMGLGLSLVHGIVQDHHGTIDVESQVGAGTRFVIRLPQSDVPPACDLEP